MADSDLEWRARASAGRDYWNIPRRVFLDTCVVNIAIDYGDQIHQHVGIPAGISPRLHSDIEALRGVFGTGQRAFWQLAVSPSTYHEVTATVDPHRRRYLEQWFFELWEYWSQVRRSSELPTLDEAEAIRLQLLASPELSLLSDPGDRLLMCDAVVYSCDAFCTRDWSTILKHRDGLASLPIRIITPAEWWAMIRPWAAIWW